MNKNFAGKIALVCSALTLAVLVYNNISDISSGFHAFAFLKNKDIEKTFGNQTRQFENVLVGFENRFGVSLDPRTRSIFQRTTTILELQTLIHKHISTVDYTCKDERTFGSKRRDGIYNYCQDGTLQLKFHSCVVYSFGSKYEFSFEDDIYDEYRCEIHTFDPFVSNSHEYERQPGMFFHPIGLNGYEYEFIRNETSYKMLTLSGVMKKLNHSDKIIDAVKIDIEMSEWSTVLTALEMGSFQNIKQLFIEFHTPKRRRSPDKVGITDYAYMLEVLYRLNEAGFLKFTHHPKNGCPMYHVMSSEEANNIGTFCCYEVFYINSNFLST